MPAQQNRWPELPPPDAWQDTLTTVHLWSQLLGKIRLTLGPWVNHSWGSALYVTTRGLTTSPIPYQGRTFSLDFDLVDHALRWSDSEGGHDSFDLGPMSVAAFHRQTQELLQRHGIHANVFTRPVEVEEAIPFEQDEVHASYDADAVHRYWRALVQAARVFAVFRARFLGKVSPVHFFWGAFDLALTRFSGRTAPRHPGGAPNCADWVMEEAYSHEVSSAGFWAGTGVGEAAFYSYAYPEPEGYRDAAVQPSAATYHSTLGEFLLPYAAVRSAADPDRELLAFLQSTYAAAADLGAWDRAALERDAPPGPGWWTRDS